MSEDASKRRLGRGLAALIGEMDKPEAATQQRVGADRRVPIEFVRPNPRNPRRSFADADLADLAQSIREHGIVQPVVVRPGSGEGQFEIIAGERRWRAAQRAGLTEIPVLVRDVDDRVALEIAIIENVQRSDLNPVDEALGYQQLIDEHSYTQADLGQVIGKSRSHVANLLRLLTLPEPVLDLVRNGQLSAGHARALVTAQDPEGLAKQVIARDLSVRQTEALARAATERPAAQRRAPEEKDADTRALESDLTANLRLKVTIEHKPGTSDGEVRIRYQTLEELDRLCQVLSG